MNLLEKVIILVLAIAGLTISFSLVFNYQPHPIIFEAPFWLFIVVFSVYGLKMKEKKKQALLFTYVVLSLIDFFFSIQDWKGQLLIGVINLIILLMLSIIWFLEKNKLKTEDHNKKTRWVSILFLVFLVSQFAFITISFLILIALLSFTIKLFKNHYHQLKNDDRQMIKITVITGVFMTSMQLKFILFLFVF